MTLYPGLPRVEGPDGVLHGHLDWVDWRNFGGWAFNLADMDVPVWLEAQIDEATPVRFMANMLRGDLADAGIGSGRFGFQLHFPEPLDATRSHRVVVRRVSDRLELPNSPWDLMAATGGDPQALSRLDALISADIAAAQRPDQLATITRFLVTQTDRVLQSGSDIANGRLARSRFRRRWAETLGGTPLQASPPDPRELGLFIDLALPQDAAAHAMLRGMQALGLRVAVVAARDLVAEGEAAETLRADDVLVEGLPFCFTVEDVLRRHAGEFRLVVLRGPVVAAAYGMAARLHQPRGRILAWLESAEQHPVAGMAAQLLVDAVIAATPEDGAALARRVQGREVHVASVADEAALRLALGRAAGITPKGPSGPS